MHGKFQCSECFKVEKGLSKIKRHIRLSHKLEQCSLCDEKMEIGNLKYHKMSCHGEFYRFRCKNCFCAFSRNEHLKVHRQSCYADDKCHSCKSSSKEKGLYKSHVKSCGLGKRNERYQIPKSIQQKTFPIKSTLKPNSETKTFNCPYCPYEGLSEARLRKHFRNPKCKLLKMRSILMENKTSKQFKCSVCSSFFASLKAAKRHEKVKKNHTYVQNSDFVNENDKKANDPISAVPKTVSDQENVFHKQMEEEADDNSILVKSELDVEGAVIKIEIEY